MCWRLSLSFATLMGSSDALRDVLAQRKAAIDRGLSAIPLGDRPAALYEPVRYALRGEGKRVRPALTLLAAEAFGGTDAAERALDVALAVEVFHTFTLVHDDVMDGSEIRRGRPSVWARWDVPTAILTGDLLMGLAYRLLDTADLDAETGRTIRDRFHGMVARLCEGQASDMAFETRDDVTHDAYLAMIDGKTGALLSLALEAGALAGGADATDAAALGAAGRDAGRAFQLQDDLLDLTAVSDAWGKPVGQDLVEGKRTALLLRARERSLESDAAPDDAPAFRAVLDGLDPERVPEIRDRMRRLGVLDAVADDVARAARAGADGLRVLPDTDAARALRAVVLALAGRSV